MYWASFSFILYTSSADINLYLYQDYIYKVPVVLHDNLQRESHKPFGPLISVT
jgi:hypothetical protein